MPSKDANRGIDLNMHPATSAELVEAGYPENEAEQICASNKRKYPSDMKLPPQFSVLKPAGRSKELDKNG